MAHISPYEINSHITKLINLLEQNFSTDTEKEILSKLNKIDSYPDMSRYQLSLTKKNLGDCYMKYGITGNALEMYQWALKDNKNLPLKRIIKKLSDYSPDKLVYSVDIHYMDKNDIIKHTTSQVSNEYDQEYEDQLYDCMGKLGDDYRKEFYRLRQVHDFYSSKPEDDFRPVVQPKEDSSTYSFLGMTKEERLKLRQKYMDEINQEYEKNWDKITAASMAKSKSFSDRHESLLNPARNLLFDENEFLAPQPIKNELSDCELLFIKYIHHKPISLDYIPGYFTYEHHIDYCDTIRKAFIEGLLTYAPASFTLSKMTIAELKTFLNENGIKATGKKADLINTIQSSLCTDCFTKKYYELTENGIEKTGYVDIYH